MKFVSKHRALMCVVSLGPIAVSLVGSTPPLHAQTLPRPAALIGATQYDVVTTETLLPQIGGPTLVTLWQRDVPLQTAVARLLKAAQLPTAQALDALSPGDKARTVTVKWINTPFWEAARDLEHQTGLRWSLISGGQHASLHLIAADKAAQEASLSVSGAPNPLVMMTIAQPVAPRRAQGLNGAPPPKVGNTVAANQTKAGQGSTSTTMRVSAYLDPHLRFVPASVGLEITTPASNGLRNFYYSSPMVFGSSLPDDLSTFQIALFTPQGQAPLARLPLIQGSLYAGVIKQSEVWEIPDLIQTKTATHKVDDTTYKLEDASLNGDTLTVQVSAYTARPRWETTLGSVPLRLLDEQGQSIPLNVEGNSSGASYGADATYRGSFNFSLRPAGNAAPDAPLRTGPFKLVWEIPTEVQILKVPFEFRDVPLP